MRIACRDGTAASGVSIFFTKLLHNRSRRREPLVPRDGALECGDQAMRRVT
jgi:hypothetical protein